VIVAAKSPASVSRDPSPTERETCARSSDHPAAGALPGSRFAAIPPPNTTDGLRRPPAPLDSGGLPHVGADQFTHTNDTAAA
jgi:hypothetical protein